MTPTTNSTEQEEGWVGHDGLSNPFAPTLHVMHRNGQVTTGKPYQYLFEHRRRASPSDVIAYRIVEGA